MCGKKERLFWGEEEREIARENIMNSDNVVQRGVKAAGAETK